VFPNAGNPQKVQRFPREWAVALRAMAAKQPELFLPAHGLPIGGGERIARVLGEVASALEFLVEETLVRMNAGERLDTIVHEVRLPAETLAKAYLRPVYDEPEFVVRNIWRLYGGWWDGDPSQLKPAPRAKFAAEMVALSGGVEAVARRALALAESGDDESLRLAGQLAQLAVDADPSSRAAHAARAEVFERRVAAEASTMSKGVFSYAANESRRVVGG
jgi:alkyl sulfatase BDS1-like metallo-beta-lactamase superfamily hydrolase